MNLETFTQLLETYGTPESNWPAEIRASAREYLLASNEARARLEQYAPLDVALDRYAVNPDTARIRAALLGRIGRKSLIDRVTGWLLPESGDFHAFWRPALAATLPLILGIILGSTLSIGTVDSQADTWSDEMSLVALSDDETESLP